MTLPTAPATDRPFVVQLEEFSGPLDLLLHLIREQEIEITDIPIDFVFPLLSLPSTKTDSIFPR